MGRPVIRRYLVVALSLAAADRLAVMRRSQPDAAGMAALAVLPAVAMLEIFKVRAAERLATEQVESTSMFHRLVVQAGAPVAVRAVLAAD